MSKPKSNDTGDNRRFQIFVPVWAGFALLLFASTWKLWTPQTEFPQIPFFGFLVGVPPAVDWIATALVAAGVVGCVLSKRDPVFRLSAALFATAALALVLLDQHRLQPWAYHFIVFAVLIAAASPRTAFFWMRWIVISIYAYSAISKFDYQFIHTVGDQMLSMIAGFAGQETSDWTDATRHWLTIGFPVGELLVAVGLAVPRLRRSAIWAAIVLHLTLLWVLGPFGLNHQPGVLVWNLFFIVQVIFLFGERTESNVVDQTNNARPMKTSLVASLMAIFVIVFPATQPFGICDHWPGWEVYAPRSSRARLVTLPDENLIPGDSIAVWSISTLGVPVYPQARFQLAVLMAALENLPGAHDRAIEVSTQSDRWTGARETETLTGDQLKMWAQRYWLNLKPRSTWTNRIRADDPR